MRYNSEDDKMHNIFFTLQEWGIMIWASLTLLFSSASQMATPLFFGMVVDAALKDMGQCLLFCAQIQRKIVLTFYTYVQNVIKKTCVPLYAMQIKN